MKNIIPGVERASTAVAVAMERLGRPRRRRRSCAASAWRSSTARGASASSSTSSATWPRPSTR
ncbi:MAG: hypothetical protein MZV63_31795 [Marinilabiliales bacterium]|nr:hypothetical protein [Marinilabiliales bacterium]